ncbi:SEC-C domain-containing protein [Kribbella sp. NBC_01505]|uniref:SEC-C metal-binding domain-containing protein n=1 Tax=Kribbella sp. NBC_01505 TaxID=2903580 RepID=UPI00386C38AF
MGDAEHLHHPILQAAAEILAARGPLTDDELFTELGRRGVDLGADPAEAWGGALDGEPDSQVVLLADDRWAWLPTLLAGRTFARRVTETEAAHDVLFLTPDLTAAALLFGTEDAQLLDGTPVELIVVPFEPKKLEERGIPLEDMTDYEVVLLPAGYWSGKGVKSGDVIALRIAGDGLGLEVADGLVGTKASTATAHALNVLLERREPEQLDAAIWLLCAEDPELFREPLLPLDELFAANGLRRLVDFYARADFDFEAWRAESRIANVMEHFELDEEEALAVIEANRLYEQVDDLSELTEESQELLTLLDEPVVALALLEHTTRYDAGKAAALARLTKILEPQLPRSARPALLWLRAKSQELLGDVATAEQTLLAAESLDADWPLSLFDLARYAFDRGDTTRGLSLLGRMGAPDDDQMLEAFQRYHAAPRTDIGRNDDCWCGSGRKYKKCHLTGGALPQEERALWLYEKACRYLMDPPREAMHSHLADVRAEYAETEEEFFDAVTDPLVMDALLFEGGIFAEFLSTRGVLLPDDEQLLAQQWVQTSRSVYEVTKVIPGAQLTLRDLRSGELEQARERAASPELTTGDLVLVRIAESGDGPAVFGGVELVALDQRDELIALLDSGPTPDELIEFSTRRPAHAVPEA